MASGHVRVEMLSIWDFETLYGLEHAKKPVEYRLFLHGGLFTIYRRKNISFSAFSRKEGRKLKIDWKKKLTSRKFWAAVIGFISAILVAVNEPEMEMEQIIAVVSGAAVLIAYIVGEGLVDAASAGQDVVIEEYYTDELEPVLDEDAEQITTNKGSEQ